MNVFYITDFWFPKIGGMERSIDNLCSTLPPPFTAELLTCHAPAGDNGRFGYPVVRLPATDREGYYSAAAERIVRAEAPRVVHVFGFSYFWPAAQARFLAAAAVMPDTLVLLKIPTHGDASRSLRDTHAGLQRIVHRFVALTDAVADELTGCGVPRVRIARIPNGVRTEVYERVAAEARQQARQALGLPPDRFLIGFCGRFERRKRIDVLASAVEMLPRSGRPCLVLAGGTDHTFGQGVELANLLGEDVRWLPERQDIRPFYRAMDLYVSASEAEGMSNAVLEAMASGLPVVASDIPGHRELVRPGENGFLFRPGSVRDLARCLAAAGGLWQSGGIEPWGAVSRRIAERRFDQRRITRRYEQLYVRAMRGLVCQSSSDRRDGSKGDP